MSQNKYSYNVLLQRIDEEGLTVQLIDRDLTADDAINLMLHIQEEVPTIEEDTISEEVNIEYSEETSAPIELQEPLPKKKQPKTKEKPHLEDARRLIKEGKETGEIAKELGVTTSRIYQLRYKMKKDGDLDVPGQPEPQEDHSDIKRGKTVTDEPEAKQPREEHTRPTLTTLDEDPQKKAIFRMLPEAEKNAVHDFQEGAGVSEIFRNNPSVGVHRINDLITAYGKIKLN